MFRKTFIAILTVIFMLPFYVGKSHDVFASGESVNVSLNFKYTSSQKGKLADRAVFNVPITGNYRISGLSLGAQLCYLNFADDTGAWIKEPVETEVNLYSVIPTLKDGSKEFEKYSGGPDALVSLDTGYNYFFKNLAKDANVKITFECRSEDPYEGGQWLDAGDRIVIKEEVISQEDSPIVDAAQNKSGEQRKWEWGQELEPSQDQMDKYYNQKPERLVIAGIPVDNSLLGNDD